LGPKLGSGAFGEVLQGKWRGGVVAIKILHKQDKKNTEMFFKEADLLCKLRHPNIVQSLGACIHPPHLCIVMDFLPLCLSNIVRKGTLSDELFLRIIKGIAVGLNYLHKSNPKIIHRDLKPANILLDYSYNTKIADFGVSREKIASVTMTRIGTPHYCAPEILKAKKYGEKVDVYSFAMVLWEMLTGKVPFSGMGTNGEDLSAVQVMMKVAVEKVRPEIPKSCPKMVYKLIEDCWQHDPLKRPSVDEIITRLEQIN